MTRYILIDHNSGFIWADSAMEKGALVQGQPEDYARIVDGDNNERWDHYDMNYGTPSSSRSADPAPAYHVYEIDDGIDLEITDGQKQDQIEAVEEKGSYIGWITRTNYMPENFLDEPLLV